MIHSTYIGDFFIIITESALSAQFPRFGGGPAPFGGLGHLREAAAAAGNPLNFPGLAGSAADPFGLSRPGFPSTSLASGWQSRLPTLDNKMEVTTLKEVKDCINFWDRDKYFP